MTDIATIVVIGATGHFGGRICRRIAGEKNTMLVVTSRSEAGAKRLAADLQKAQPEAAIRGAAIDYFSPSFERDLQALQPDIVIHTAGPYQGQDYRVAEACIGCGSHYIDLADGRDFVSGFAALHQRALQSDLLLVSGASTLPGLSSAVIDSLRDRFETIREIDTCILPAHQTPRGAGTVSAVLSYCGRPFDTLVDGGWKTIHGWQNLRSENSSILGYRYSAACDVPDLALLVDYVPGVRTVTFQASLEAKWEHAALWLMGWLTRWRIVTNWDRFVPAFRRISNALIRLGSDIGGMRVTLAGTGKDQKELTVSWLLTAMQNHGPEVPCSPALVIARKLCAGNMALRGAHACLGLVTLQEFDDEVSALDIDWQLEEQR